MKRDPEAWRKHVEKQRSSGLTGAEYCRRQGINYGTFGYWVQRLREPQSEGKFVEVGATPEQAAIEVAVGKAVIRVPAGADMTQLRRLVEALSC